MSMCVFFKTDAPLLKESTCRIPMRKTLSYTQRATELPSEN